MQAWSLLLTVTEIRTAAGSDARKEKSKRKLRIVAEIQEYGRLTKLHGGLLPQSFVAAILGVSRQRPTENCHQRLS
jgi:hypothetical protein